MVIETNEEVAADLADAGIGAITESAGWTAQFTAPHEPTPMGSQPHNVGFVVGGVFAHPGDSYTFDAAASLLALPFLPPWGSTTEAVTLAKRLRPQYVVPIHDWYLEQRGKGWLYGSVERVLAEEGITLLALDDFEAVSVDVG
jgi:L-ascorbate metabolism protein UlaG (beta-lactamase superfamily)